MPFYGGIIGINKVFTPDGFDGASSPIKGITVIKSVPKMDNGKASFSFTTVKVDNVDLSGKNIRILNAKGSPDFRGRVEMRVAGVLQTLSATGTDNTFA